MKNIVVIGSLNLDVVEKIDSLPLQGATVRVAGRENNLGGKGANQAIAAARQGAHVSFIGAVGDDAAGQMFRETLTAEHIDGSGIVTKSVATGTATILLEADGHNTILVFGGANAELNADDVVASEHLIAQADIVIAQFEVPQTAVAKAFYLAKKYGAKTLLNPAPIINQADIMPEILACTDIIVPNETEAAALVGAAPSTNFADLCAIRTAMQRLMIPRSVITLGEAGVFTGLNNASRMVPVFPVKAIDTTAAGDTFIGAMVAELRSDLKNEYDAIQYASRASSITVQRPGAMKSIPTRQEVLTAGRL
ncbi:ribokinase [Weissella soli]|uniref:ribokinase n=1 Tax=Weissella soli TaxID=155866 RepID=UPI0035A05BBD